LDDLTQDFLGETSENLSNLDVQLVELETNPNDPALIDNIFRVMHTIKGTAGMVGLNRLGSVAHKAEDLLDQFRNGAEVDSASVTVILCALDTIQEIVKGIYELDGAEPEGDDDIIMDLIEDTTRAAKARVEGSVEALEVEEPEVGGVSGENDADASDEPSDVPSVEKDEPAAAPSPSQDKHEKAQTPHNQMVRIDVGLLDNLMDLVGELVLARNQIQQISKEFPNSNLTAPVQNLSHVASELQESVMKTRMQPIIGAWKVYPRMVRDLANKLGKKIEINMVGENTEIDRQVLELIKDPLTHMIRNCADHALEEPKERLAGGKFEKGRITLKAFHEGGHIIIQIIDDGRGINVDRVSRKALEKNLVSQEQLDNMTPNRIRSIIFQPGFSTAETVSSVSGRGVGMDVVRNNIEQIGGTISVDSEEGVGTTFSIKIPLTLAIISAFVVGVGNHTFAIPQLNVQEIVNTTFESEAYRIDWIDNSPLLRLRGKTYPVLCLSDVLEIDAKSNSTIMVCQIGSETFGIMVDRVVDIEEVVVKPLSRALQDTGVFSGNTILGDGSVIMILDPNGLFSTFGIPARVSEDELEHDIGQVENDIVKMVIFRAGGYMRKGVHLSVVSRIDKVETSRIKHTEDDRYVAQYGDYLMPVICPGTWQMDMSQEMQTIMIFKDQDKSMGLAVDPNFSLEIVETDVVLDVQSSADGLIGSAVLDGEATEIIDISYFLDKAFGNWFKNKDGNPPESKVDVLIVDDSQFFRNVLLSMISARGYNVQVARDPSEAMALMRRQTFDVLVSDIEMPVMNGLDFIREIRSRGPQKDIKAVAISSHGTTEDREIGLHAGFDEYLSKTDRESIFDFLRTVLKKKDAKDEG